MNNSSSGSVQVNTKLLGMGAVLLCLGGAVVLTGAACASLALAQAAKKWYDQLEVSPTEMAQRQLHNLMAAAEAGSKAYREQSA